ncbi:hypothetical protein [Sagittula sp. S175]|uniref:hypothetical protein n=1 Tax=Sagittula sp. S175 TaxID=3415129 RepID=UPI003C7BF04F
MIRVSGHFGEWLQGRLDGRVVLVSMACDALAVRAEGDARLFPEDVLARFCAGLGLAGEVPGVVADMPPGGGAGVSTASLVAVARAMGFDGAPEVLARACLAVEGACDPLMFEGADRLLWASRAAEVVERMAPPPACEVVGGFWGAPTRTDARDDDFPEVSDLVSAWRQAVEAADLARAAAVASESAARCTALRGPGDDMAELARALGALGVVRAHTGSARGLIFAPGDVPERAEDVLREAGLTGVLRFRTGGGA